jgi:hypothetical protein
VNASEKGTANPVDDQTFEIVVRMHTADSSSILSHPEAVRFLVGAAFDAKGLQEEIDYTLTVDRRYYQAGQVPGGTQ